MAKFFKPQEEDFNKQRFRELWRLLNSGNCVTVCTDETYDPMYVFGKYYDMFKIFIKRNMLIVESLETIQTDNFFAINVKEEENATN